MNEPVLPLHSEHSRRYRQNRYVYPVLSRRSRGMSLGVNLNPDKICNFDCIYCQVDRRTESDLTFVDLEGLLAEVEWSLIWIVSGEIYEDPHFATVPLPLRRLNDIAFSGDGEPTTYRNFDQLMQQVAEVRRRCAPPETKMVLITNASMFHRPVVQRGLEILDANNGEIWAKLDAGTEPYFQLIDRTTIRFQQVLDNILDAARVRPLVIQSLFMKVQDEPPDEAEIDAFCGRLAHITESGGELKLVQVYTVARPPAESYVTPLDDPQVDAIADRVRQQTGLKCECYYGGSVPGS